MRVVSQKGFQGGTSGKESTYQIRRFERHSFDPWIRKILWSRAWQPTPVFLPGESHGQRNLIGPWSPRVRMTEATQHAFMVSQNIQRRAYLTQTLNKNRIPTCGKCCWCSLKIPWSYFYYFLGCFCQCLTLTDNFWRISFILWNSSLTVLWFSREMESLVSV